MNTFVEAMAEMQNKMDNFKRTENGALAYESTMDKVYDMFAFEGAYRQRTNDEVVALYADAYAQSPVLATKCLFYLRDVRGGQGERRFFREAFKWLIWSHIDVARALLTYISEYGRWDDLIDVCYGTKLWNDAIFIMKDQLSKDLLGNDCSLLAKWMPSANASSKNTKKKAYALMKSFGLTPRQYRKMLSHLREKINVLERLMSANRWEDIEFDKIPSKAGILYKNAFQRRDLIKEKYKNFITSEDTKVNAATLYPYEIVNKVSSYRGSNEIDRAALDKYWKNLPDYFNGKSNSMMCVCDTSGSMTWGMNVVAPIDVAISLSIYAAEHNEGPFKDCYISFASRPQFIQIKGKDITEKVQYIRSKNLVDTTDLEAVFDLLRRGCINHKWAPEDMPKSLVIISDMEINQGIDELGWRDDNIAIKGLMEQIRDKWIADGLGAYFPKLIYWNVNARNDTILDMGPNVSYVSGCSPVLFEQVISGKSGYDLMFDKLLSKRYNVIDF